MSVTAEAATERKNREIREGLIRNRDAAANLLDQAEAAMRDGDAERVRETLVQVTKRIAEGGTDDHKPRLARCSVELDMLRELDRIDKVRLTMVDGKLPE